MAKAVEDSARPSPTITDAAAPMPSAPPKPHARSPIASPQPSTCAAPRPKISRRMLHRREGCNSSPIRKSRNTMPSSAKCSTASPSLTYWKTGPITMPAAR